MASNTMIPTLLNSFSFDMRVNLLSYYENKRIILLKVIK